MTIADRKTPETDAAIVSAEYIRREMDYYKHKFILADWARKFERERDAAMEELRNIANTNISLWEKDMRDQFQPWAKNRARDTLRAIEESKRG